MAGEVIEPNTHHRGEGRMTTYVLTQQDIELEARIAAESDLAKLKELMEQRRPEFIAFREAQVMARIKAGL